MYLILCTTLPTKLNTSDASIFLRKEWDFFTIHKYFVIIILMGKINIYIDGNNLYRSAKELDFEIDYKKFRGWLKQKYNPNFVYLFIGLVPERTNFYEYLQRCGYILVFKQTVSVGEKI